MTVNFHPRMLQADVRKTGLRCAVEGLEAPLTITLSGMCIEKVPFKDVSPSIGSLRPVENT